MAKEIKLPDLGEGVREGELVKLHVSKGDTVVLDQILLEVMTDKATMEIPSATEGEIESVLAQEGDIVQVGQTLFELKGGNDQASSKKEPAQNIQTKEKPLKQESSKKPPSHPADTEGSHFIKSAPSTRKLAKELGIDLKDVPKRSSNEVSREDLLQFARLRPQESRSVVQKFTPQGEIQFQEPIRGIQKSMFDSMSYSKQTIPHFSILDTAKMDRLVEVRENINQILEKEDIKLSYLPFIMKACTQTLKEFPKLNSFLDAHKMEVLYPKHINFGFAVDTPDGLLVPVIKSVEALGIKEIALKLKTLSNEAREGKIAREDLQEGNFTLTNLGSLGGMYGTPIINPPQVSILGIYKMYHNITNRDEKVHRFMNFSITCDHRVIDGATATRFLRSLIIKMEEPSLLLLS